MTGKAFFGDETGVSPVVGVILMIAITIILAAAAGSFILGFGDSMGEVAPQVSVECNTADNIITHQGGNDLIASELRLDNPDGSNIDSLSGGQLTAGDPIVGGASGNSISSVSGDERLVWENPDSDSTQIIAEC